MNRILIATYLSMLVACSSTTVEAPTEFELGEEVEAPIGCQDLRNENPEADC